MGVFSIIETFIFFSLAISFVLILLLVYHFKSRMAKLEEKTDTMVGIINDIAKELANAPIIGQAPPDGHMPPGMCSGPPPGMPPMPPMGGGIPGIPPLGGMPFPMSFMMNLDPFGGMPPMGPDFGMGPPPGAPVHPESDKVEEIPATDADADDEEESDDDSDSDEDSDDDDDDEPDIDQVIKIDQPVEIADAPVDLAFEVVDLSLDQQEAAPVEKIVVPDMTEAPAVDPIPSSHQEDHESRKRTLPDLRQEVVTRGLAREKDAAKMKKAELLDLLANADASQQPV